MEAPARSSPRSETARLPLVNRIGYGPSGGCRKRQKRERFSCARLRFITRGSLKAFGAGWLARARSYPKITDLPRIIDAWKWSYAQIRTQRLVLPSTPH